MAGPQEYEKQLEAQRMRVKREDLAARQAQEQSIENAMGMLATPQLAQGQSRFAEGPEGRLWKAIEQQKQQMQMAGQGRGYNPGAARAAGYGAAEMESRAYGAAEGLRAEDEASRRAARLAVQQQASQFDIGQMGLETGAMQAQLQQQAFEQQMAAQEEARKREQEAGIISGILGAAGSVGGAALGMKSDERLKENISTASAEDIDKLMAKLGSGKVVSDLGSAAQFSGEYGDEANPKSALVYVGDRAVLPSVKVRRGPEDELAASDRAYAAFLAEKATESPSDAEEMPSRSDLDFVRQGIAITPIGEGGPSQPQRMYVEALPRAEEFRPVVPTRAPMEVEARAFNEPFNQRVSAAERAEFVRRMTEGAESAGEQAARGLAMATGPLPRARVREVVPSYEDAVRDRRRSALLEALDQIAAEPQRSQAARRSAIEAGLDQMRSEQDQTLRGLRGIEFDYLPQVGQPGRKFGISAQELERTPLGRGLVRETPGGKVVDVGQSTGAILGMLGRINERLQKVEGK